MPYLLKNFKFDDRKSGNSSQNSQFINNYPQIKKIAYALPNNPTRRWLGAALLYAWGGKGISEQRVLYGLIENSKEAFINEHPDKRYAFNDMLRELLVKDLPAMDKLEYASIVNGNPDYEERRAAMLSFASKLMG